MKIWSVFSLVILFHFAVIGLLLFQPGCQSRSAPPPDPSVTAPGRPIPPAQPQRPAQVEELDAAFNAGLPAAGGSARRTLSSPTRPETMRRAEPDTDLLEPVREPARDSFSLPPQTREYTVQRGDTLSGIARREGVSLAELLSANGLDRNATIYIGQTLLVPEQPARADTAPGAEAEHGGNEVEVRPGDTLSAIAARHGTTVAIIQSLNGLTRDTIYVGQKLLLPDSAASPQRAPAPAGRTTATGGAATYTVKAGDTPSGIARQFGISASELMAANAISDPRKLRVGMELTIPRGRSGPAQPTSPAARAESAPTSPAAQSGSGNATTARSTPEPRDDGPADPVEADPMSALEALEDEDLPFVEVEVLEEDTPNR
jgi:LysM repeat protein